MHEVYEKIDSANDIESAVSGLCMEGKLTDPEGQMLVQQINSHLTHSKAAEWFKPGLKVLKENEILLPSGVTRRPDRIIIEDGKAIVIDFKFGEEKAHYLKQVGEYRDLMSMMGYRDIEAYIWYVEKDKIVKA